MMSATTRLAGAGLVVVMAVAGCGDDTDDGDAEASSIDEYCAVIEEVGDELPTDEQFDRILEAAPEEIAENLEIVVGAIREDGEAAFASAEVAENFPAIQTFEAENCGGDGEAASAEVDPDATRIDVTATEYAFDFTEPGAGPVSFVIANEGSEVHEMLLTRFVGEATFEDAMAAEDPEAEGLVETIGFAGPIVPGSETVLNVADLEPGRYAIVCLIPTTDGASHAEKGMVSQFTVA